MAPQIQIHAAADTDRQRIGALMVDAFLQTPDGLWIEPDEHGRRSLYRQLAGPLFDHAHHHGQVDVLTIANVVVAAAIWWPHPQVHTEATQVVALSHLVENISPHAAKRLAQLAAAMAAHQPPTDHQYLAYIGVARHRQAQGHGSALLAHCTAHLDAAGDTAYLVATSTGSRDLFTRHGFAPTDVSPFQLPDAGPPLWGMLRPPQTGTPE